jgi:hypothetical protein
VDESTLGEDIFVGDGSGELQIRDGQAALGTLGGNERRLDSRGEGLPPYNRSLGGLECVKPDATHPQATGIAGPHIGRCHRYQLTQTRRTLTEGRRQPFEVVNARKDMPIQAEAMMVASAQSILED